MSDNTVAPALLPTTLLTVSTNQISSDIGEEIVVMHLQNGIYHGLQGVAARVWQLLEQPVSVQAVINHIVSEYDVSQSVCQRDVFSLLNDLQHQGLIDVVDPSYTQILRA